MRYVLWFVCLGLLGGCGGVDESKKADQEDAGWAVTAWGARFEIFAECDPLESGRPSGAYTHVTHIEDFAPLRAGSVAVILRKPGGLENVFRQEQPLRDGIFRVEMNPTETGEFAISFLVETAAAKEEIAAGTVRVGSAESAGGLIGVAPAARGDGTELETRSGQESVSFLKEQQWRTAFGTDWSRDGSLRITVKGPGRIRVAAGAEAILAAPVDGLVSLDHRLHVGFEVDHNHALVRLAPRATSNRTFSELEAEAEVARARLARLERLLEIQAVSAAEVEAARARVASLDPQLHAALGRSGAKSVEVTAPFPGRVAEVHVISGQAVSAGDPLVRIVRTNPLWVEAMLAPRDALRAAQGVAGLVLEAPGSSPVLVDSTRMRLVTQAPEVDRSTGTVATFFEVRDELPFRPGTAVDVEVLLLEEERGVVVPASALIDDGGVPVVYVQIDGEAFVRSEVKVRARQGERALIDGLPPGLRFVTRGGGAIRRATLMKSGSVEGHVH